MDRGGFHGELHLNNDDPLKGQNASCTYEYEDSFLHNKVKELETCLAYDCNYCILRLKLMVVVSFEDGSNSIYFLSLNNKSRWVQHHGCEDTKLHMD